jgi:preprotein translocase subunit Sec63
MLRAEKQEDLYKILGITKKADQSEVKTVFRKLALKWHPDKNDSPEAKETFQKISMAYSSKPFSPLQKKNLSSNNEPPPKKRPSGPFTHQTTPHPLLIFFWR